MEGKGGRCVGLTDVPPSCVDCFEIWEPQISVNFRACPGLFRGGFTITTILCLSLYPPNVDNMASSYQC